MTTPTHIGSRRELFVDSDLTEALSGGAEQRLHCAEPREIVLDLCRPWEGNKCSYVTVFRDGEVFRMYYQAWSVSLEKTGKGNDGRALKSGLKSLCYAESHDGLHWERPALGIVEYEGSTENNIVWAGADESRRGVSGVTPFRDTNPDCQPEQQYKAVGAAGYAVEDGLYALSSPDGLHWSLMRDEPILQQGRDGTFDSQNQAFWDAERGEYRVYFRGFAGGGFETGMRAIKTSTSPDFLHWSEPEWLAYPGAPEEQLYTNQVMSYPRAPHIYVGFPSRYIHREWSEAIEALPEPEHRRKAADLNPRFGTSLTDGLFMSSRDGVTFHRWGEAFLRPGPQLQGNWCYSDNYQSRGLIETPSHLEGAPSVYSFFAIEDTWRRYHTLVRRYTIRKDGFVSVRAPLKGGEVLTRPVVFDGARLSINFATSVAGSVHVEIQDGEGNPMPGFTLEDSVETLGDELDREVRWTGGADVSTLAGKPVRLRFVLKDANLYSYRFGG
jgi:hypothetical protein